MRITFYCISLFETEAATDPILYKECASRFAALPYWKLQQQLTQICTRNAHHVLLHFLIGNKGSS
jgi:hypothetical protein